jgi:hypothetical protein
MDNGTLVGVTPVFHHFVDPGDSHRRGDQELSRRQQWVRHARQHLL